MIRAPHFIPTFTFSGQTRLQPLKYSSNLLIYPVFIQTWISELATERYTPRMDGLGPGGSRPLKFRLGAACRNGDRTACPRPPSSYALETMAFPFAPLRVKRVGGPYGAFLVAEAEFNRIIIPIMALLFQYIQTAVMRTGGSCRCYYTPVFLGWSPINTVPL